MLVSVIFDSGLSNLGFQRLCPRIWWRESDRYVLEALTRKRYRLIQDDATWIFRSCGRHQSVYEIAILNDLNKFFRTGRRYGRENETVVQIG
jgi:hypothetical protein